MDVAIIGCGVVGLSTGILLSRKGYKVNIYARALPPNVVSNAACAIWLPFFASDVDEVMPNYEQAMEQWCADSWKSFAGLVGDEYGVRWVTNHEMFLNEEPPPPYLLKTVSGFEATYDFDLPKPFIYRWSIRTFVIETPTYMMKLVQDFQKGGGRIILREFHSLSDLGALSEKVIFNCTGLGSRELFSDKSVYGVKGQLLLHDPVAIDFALGGGEFCLIPRSDTLILGAIFQEQFDSEEPTEENTELLWNVLSGWCSGRHSVIDFPQNTLSRDKIRSTIAGIRPYRSKGIRVELERLGNKYVIHDYGHGGSGIALSWGCAMHAVRLFEILSSNVSLE